MTRKLRVLSISCTLVLLIATWGIRGSAQEASQAEAPSAESTTKTLPASGPPPGSSRPQAKTPEEAAAFQAFVDEQNPDRRIRLVEDFLLFYPETDLKESAYQVAMQAYQVKGDFEHALTYGELALAENPKNVIALLTLATAISESTGRDVVEGEQRLAEGDQYALQALEVLGSMRRPPGFPEQQWNDARQESESVAHAARGLIAMIREDFVRAELELKEALALTKNPNPALLYRLGMSYSFQKKYAEALEVLNRAASMGGIQITTGGGTTRDIVAEAREFVSKALAGSAPPTAAAEPMTPGEMQPSLAP